MLSSLTQPNYPRAALGFGNNSVSAVSLQKNGPGQYSLRQAATTLLPAGLVVPSFVERNINDQFALADHLERVSLECGLRGQKQWSVSLPSTAARTAILSIKEVPASKKELEEVLDFKAETSFGVPSAELRISMEKVSTDAEGRSRYFATAVKLGVIDEYETVFESLGWRAGLILPRAVSELSWLTGSRLADDALLISSQENGFTALLLRAGEPALVRSVICADREIDDEIFRLLVYYKDRFEQSGSREGGRFLVIGEGALDERFRGISAEALGKSVRLLGPSDLGLLIPSAGVKFSEIAAPAGLATLGWR
jgi:Tfp pilus assembly PilM family ATPase